MTEPPLLTVEDLVVTFRVSGGHELQAVSGISFQLPRGETLGIVGESGCGKSTTGRAIIGMLRPAAGRVTFDGHVISELSPSELRQLRPRVQIVFQDPISSLNPRRRVADIIAEPLQVWKRKRSSDGSDQIQEMMTAVGLDYHSHGQRRPHELSGGQCQRVSIARALMLNPDLLICDEPVSALDVSVQAQILNLLEDMKSRYGLTMIFIAHDLAVVHNVADRVAVMYLGKIVEVASPDDLYRAPAHHYTAGLLASVPTVSDEADHRRPQRMIKGEPPSPLDPPSGCRFRTRCPASTEICATTEPPLEETEPGHAVACHHPLLPGGVPIGSAQSDVA